MPPPPRRRPVPNPPTTRPRVAGLRKRPEQGAHPADRPAAADPDLVTDPDLDDEPAESAPASPVGTTSTEVSGRIEPGGSVVGEDLADPSPRPRPTGRRKRTGEAVAPSVLDDADPDRAKPGADPDADHPDAEPGPHDTGGADRASRRDDRTPAAAPGLVLPTALVVLAGLLVGLGLWFQDRAGDVSYDRALVDSAGTTEVAGQVREAVEKAFSYNFADVPATEKAANELLVGKAQCQYNAIFGPVRTLAPEQKLVVTVKAVSSGVTSLDDDRATVLLFLDQVTTRTTDNQSGGGIAMMRVGAQRVDGRWKVDNMEMFGQSGDQAAETSRC